jgi:hypothetical protein
MARVAQVQRRGRSIDAEVGMQPQIIMDQHTPGGARIRNAGLGDTQHQVVDRPLQGLPGRGSDLLAWAKQHPDELLQMLRKAIGNTAARIVPVFTGDWFNFKDLFLENHFLADLGDSATVRLRSMDYARSALEDAAHAVAEGRGQSPGLKKQIGNNKLGATNRLLLKEGIEEDFMRGAIPELMYKPSTGRVMTLAKSSGKARTSKIL